MGRQPCCDKIGLKRGPWTIEEDRKLVHFILTNGIQCWRLVPKLAGLMRCGKSCRLRWINYLRPDLKRGAFTDAEEDMIIQLHSRYGNRWSKIASHFPGRTDNEIKNYWNTRIKKKLKHLGVDPITHEPVMEPENMNNDKKETSETSSSKDQQSKSTELGSHDDDGDQISKRDGVTEVGQCEQINSFHNTELWENTNLKQAATNEFSVGITGQTFDDFYEQWMCSPNDMLPWDSFSNFDEIFLNISPNLDGAHL